MPSGVYARPVRGCSVDGCQRWHYGLGLCGRHYSRLRTNGDPLLSKYDRESGPGLCAASGCTKPRKARGYCGAHRQRVMRHGSAALGGPARIRGDVLLRIWHFAGVGPGCWPWRATLRTGYGQSWDGRRVRQAHLVAYEALIGPVPPGLVLDHTCRNKACVRPSHLEPVTYAENLRRWGAAA